MKAKKRRWQQYRYGDTGCSIMINRDFLEEAIRCFINVRFNPEADGNIECLGALANACYADSSSDAPFPDTNEIAAKMLNISFCYLSRCLLKKEYEKAADFADALHVFPEIFLHGRFAPLEYWNNYYLRFRNRYNETPLEEYSDWFLCRKAALCDISLLDSFSFPVCFDDNGGLIGRGSKIMKHDISPKHLEIISELEFNNKKLSFSDERWLSGFLGYGEEKAVYVVCDHHAHIFALELIDEKHYLNGRLVDGEYYATVSAKKLRGVRFNPESLIGLQFTGLVKVREFIYGYEWGRFTAYKNPILNSMAVMYLKANLQEEFNGYLSRFKDVHERNVMFELCPRKQKGAPLLMKDIEGNTKRFSVRLRGIDLR